MRMADTVLVDPKGVTTNPKVKDHHPFEASVMGFAGEKVKCEWDEMVPVRFLGIPLWKKKKKFTYYFKRDQVTPTSFDGDEVERDKITELEAELKSANGLKDAYRKGEREAKESGRALIEFLKAHVEVGKLNPDDKESFLNELVSWGSKFNRF